MPDEAESEYREKIDERFGRDDKRMNSAEQKIDKHDQILTRLDTIIENQQKQIDGHEQRIVDIEKRPAKWWDTAVTQIIGLVVAGVLGGLISQIKF